MLTMKWLVFVIYIGSSGLPTTETVQSDIPDYKTCRSIANGMNRLNPQPGHRFDCAWYRAEER